MAGSQPLANAEVSLAAAGETGFGRILGGGQTTTSDATGRFRFDHLGAGRYSVSAGTERQVEQPLGVRPPGGRLEERPRAVALGGLDDPGHRLGPSGRMENGATVMATGVESFFATTKVGADGTFQVTGVPAGPVTLRAQAGDGLGTSRSATKQVTASDDVPVLQTEIVFDVGFTL